MADLGQSWDGMLVELNGLIGELRRGVVLVAELVVLVAPLMALLAVPACFVLGVWAVNATRRS